VLVREDVADLVSRQRAGGGMEDRPVSFLGDDAAGTHRHCQ